MLPATNKQADALKAASEFGTAIVTEVGQLARCIGKILGTVPEDTIGLVIGDPLRLARTAIALKYEDIVDKILKNRGVKDPQPVSPSLAIPLLSAAYDESRPELQDLWANLIAAAMDPKRSNSVRKSFIEALKKLDPPDALLLKTLYQVQGELRPNPRDFMMGQLKMSQAEIEVSVRNLQEAKCADFNPGMFHQFYITSYGRELVRTCSN